MFTRDFAAEPVHIVVVALDLDHVRLVNQVAEHLRRFKVGRDEHVALHACRRRVSRDGVGQVAGRGAGHRFKAEFPRTCEGDRDDPIFERQGRMVHRIVLDIELVDAQIGAEIFRPHQRRQSRMGPDDRGAFDRQQVDIAPHAVRALFDLFPGDRAFDLVVVVFDFERAEAHLTDVDGFGWIFLPTFPAHQRFHFRHGDTFATSYVDPGAHRSARRRRRLRSIP